MFSHSVLSLHCVICFIVKKVNFMLTNLANFTLLAMILGPYLKSDCPEKYWKSFLSFLVAFV
jgi:hypothetical protein